MGRGLPISHSHLLTTIPPRPRPRPRIRVVVHAHADAQQPSSRAEGVRRAGRDVPHPAVRVVALVPLQDLQVLELQARRGQHGDGEAQVHGPDLGAQARAVRPLQCQTRAQCGLLAPAQPLELPPAGRQQRTSTVIKSYECCAIDGASCTRELAQYAGQSCKLLLHIALGVMLPAQHFSSAPRSLS